MTEHDVPFLTELGAEFRRAAHADARNVGRAWSLKRTWMLVSIPALVAIAAVALVVLGAGSPVPEGVPVINFSGQSTTAAYRFPTSSLAANQPRFVGSRACIKLLYSRHLPALVRSTAAPDGALISDLSLLREPSTPIDNISLGSWDRYPLLITTLFERYVRVLDGPQNVRVAYLPVTYCNQTQVSPSTTSPLGAQGGVFRETLEQGLVMLLLSNPGGHPPVLVGTAQQIRGGPGLAGLDLSNYRGWLQTTVVPDGVTRVVMKFTPPFLHHYSNTVQIQSNVGIVVRRPEYIPTTVLWYGSNGRLMKKFVDRRQIAYDSCLAAHGKLCGVVQTPKPETGTNTQSATSLESESVPPALMAQANALYAPVEAFEDAMSRKQLAEMLARGRAYTSQVNRCQAPYQRLFHAIYGTPGERLYMLYENGVLLGQHQSTLAPIATQLGALAQAWGAIKLTSPILRQFARGMALELRAALTRPQFDTCTFIREIAAHNYSYGWAKGSSFGRALRTYNEHITSAGTLTSAFWSYVYGRFATRTPDGPGKNLFTIRQLHVLANLPGEIG
jgi:hypothetical protein